MTARPHQTSSASDQKVKSPTSTLALVGKVVKRKSPLRYPFPAETKGKLVHKK